MKRVGSTGPENARIFICGEAPGEDDDGQRPEADEVDAIYEPSDLERRDERQGDGLEQEPPESADRLHGVDADASERLDEAQGQRVRGGPGIVHGPAHDRAFRYTPSAQSGKYLA